MSFRLIIYHPITHTFRISIADLMLAVLAQPRRAHLTVSSFMILPDSVMFRNSSMTLLPYSALPDKALK